MASPFSQSGHDCLVIVVTAMFMLGFSGRATSYCPTGTEYWLRPSDGQVLGFTSNTLSSGHTVTSVGPVLTSSFSCSTSNGYSIFLAKGVSSPGNAIDLYFCWKLVVKSQNVMLLYELTGESTDPLITNQRAQYVIANAAAPSDSTLCSLNVNTVQPKLLYSVSSASASDISVSSLDTSKIECPAALRNTYSYVMGTDCQGTDSSLDFCQDTKAARFDYAVCPNKPILFSNDGLLSCLATYTLGGTTYVLMGNHDATVSSPTTVRFVCTKITSTTVLDGYTDDCSDIGSSTHKQLTLVVKASCPSANGAGGDGGGDSPSGGMDLTPIIAGAVAGLLLIALIVAIIIVLKKKGKLGSKKKAVAPSQNGSVPASIGVEATVDDIVIDKETVTATEE